jgi:hypothetical protein
MDHVAQARGWCMGGCSQPKGKRATRTKMSAVSPALLGALLLVLTSSSVRNGFVDGMLGRVLLCGEVDEGAGEVARFRNGLFELRVRRF